ncbi:MAG: sigma 54-interacting transcriptional regulator [Acidobacteria bacterium]|nr:sigma 54-interacting transcriptional regulator [Acidobacteriota bacterium]MBS1865942.1 sigma 54-interacting transcriptional regulator [Acidobacteriota bacterium]
MSMATVQTKQETLIRHLLEGTSAKIGEEFFQALVHAAAQALDVAGVWVTEYRPDERVLRSLSFWLNGDYIEDFEYKIAGTPCEVVVDQARLVHYPDRILELFPDDPDLEKLSAVSFVGVPFLQSDGKVLGHLAAVDTKPMKLNPELESAFKIFAARAGAEFKRLRAEAKIRESEQRLSRLFESAMDAILELDEDLRILRANGSAVALFACPGKVLTDQKLTEFLAPSSAQKLSGVLQELESECQRYAWIPGGFDATKSDCSTFTAEATASRFEVNGQKRYSLILRNVQDQLAAENRLRELQEEAAYLWSEINELPYGSEILGNSLPVRDLITAIHQVAPTPATVFVSGETGTGKELVARAIHNASPRAGKPFVRVNCAAIPAALSESEFFGHERGAFTGAATRRTGRFELANGGTIFLDEVGEMPLELQPKLLRVLQEGEFEPVGSSQTRKVDVRVIAATNRDLAEEVAAGRFREDLYYRLHVFPITVPPLRERGSDVELLAAHLLKCNCKRMGKPALELTADCLRRLRSYHWPGNVRELENVIERAVILARDGKLNLRDVLPLTSLQPVAERKGATALDGLQTKKDLREAEKATLLRALEKAKWKVAGPQGAAQKLGIPASTLSSRMKALGIARPR